MEKANPVRFMYRLDRSIKPCVIPTMGPPDVQGWKVCTVGPTLNVPHLLHSISSTHVLSIDLCSEQVYIPWPYGLMTRTGGGNTVTVGRNQPCYAFTLLSSIYGINMCSMFYSHIQ